MCNWVPSKGWAQQCTTQVLGAGVSCLAGPKWAFLGEGRWLWVWLGLRSHALPWATANGWGVAAPTHPGGHSAGSADDAKATG